MKTKVISYFSYKGGAGRSTLAYNTVPLLVNEHIKPTKESPVVIVDLDIDSCGLSYLLGVQADQIRDDACVQHVLANGCNPDPMNAHIYEADLLKEMIPVGNKLGYEINEAVLFLPAKDIKNVKKTNNYDDDNFCEYMAQIINDKIWKYSNTKIFNSENFCTENNFIGRCFMYSAGTVCAGVNTKYGSRRRDII